MCLLHYQFIFIIHTWTPQGTGRTGQYYLQLEDIARTAATL